MPDRVNRHCGQVKVRYLACGNCNVPGDAYSRAFWNRAEKAVEVFPWEGLLVYRGAFRLFPLSTWWTYLARIIHQLSRAARGATRRTRG